MDGALPHLFRPTYPDFLHGAPPTPACAAFIKESRMKLANARKLDRKSGVRWGEHGAPVSHPTAVAGPMICGKDRPYSWKSLQLGMPPTRTVRAVCSHDCPDTCAVLVTVDELGRATRVQGDPDHPITRGFLCAKV